MPGALDCDQPLKYLLTFKGTVDATVGKNVATLDNGKDVRIVTQEFKANCGQKVEGDTEELCGAGQYADLMKSTQFGAVMRGDNRVVDLHHHRLAPMPSLAHGLHERHQPVFDLAVERHYFLRILGRRQFGCHVGYRGGKLVGLSRVSMK